MKFTEIWEHLLKGEALRGDEFAPGYIITLYEGRLVVRKFEEEGYNGKNPIITKGLLRQEFKVVKFRYEAYD
jgi:hypothetical protein